MTDDANQTTQTQRLLDRLAAGDDRAAEELIEHTMERIRRLASWKLQNDQRVHRWEATDDVVQNVLIRLHRSLKEVKPKTPRDFMNFAAEQIRRELIDLARHHFGPQGGPANLETDRPQIDFDGKYQPQYELEPDLETGPFREMRYVEFHEYVNQMPGNVGEVFKLRYYNGLEQAEIADALGISVSTVKHRWRDALELLNKKFQIIRGEL